MKKILSKIKVPDIGSVVNPAMDFGDALTSGVTGAFDKVTGTFDTGVGVLSSSLGGIPFFGATATSKFYDYTQFDEKHYFLIPDKASDDGYSLYVMRSLPEGVPPINDLEKRRLLHLPSESALPMLEHIVVKDARERASAEAVSGNFVSSNLDSLIDEIDKVDGKVFGGVLLLGGLVALANPLAGAAVAMKAAVPSIGLMVSKYGMKAVSETATNIDVARQIKRAEKDVKTQFKSAKTVSVVNPLLHHLGTQTSLDMWMMEAEKFQFLCDDMEFTQKDTLRLTDFTEQAISDVAKDAETQIYLEKVTAIIRGAEAV
jgi:hypothetical protein